MMLMTLMLMTVRRRSNDNDSVCNLKHSCFQRKLRPDFKSNPPRAQIVLFWKIYFCKILLKRFTSENLVLKIHFVENTFWRKKLLKNTILRPGLRGTLPEQRPFPPRADTATDFISDKSTDCRIRGGRHCIRPTLLHLTIWTNTFYNLDKYICNMEKYIFQFRQIHCAIWLNTFGYLDDYIFN